MKYVVIEGYVYDQTKNIKKWPEKSCLTTPDGIIGSEIKFQSSPAFQSLGVKFKVVGWVAEWVFHVLLSQSKS